MAKKKEKKKKVAQTSAQRPWWLWAMVAAAVLLVAGGLTVLLTSGGNTASGGTPKLVVDQTVVDEGYVTLNTSVRTSFTIRNEGEGPLRVLGEPQVQLVEGC